MTDLFLCVDPGASQTKIIYQLKGESSPNYLLMPPDVEPISQNALDLYFGSKGWLGHPSPLQQAWLHVNDRVFAVGAFASKFDPEDRLNELKYENALYKVLTAVGIILEQHELNSRKKLSLQLALLLPANEYNDRQRFKEQLTFYLNRFSFRGQLIKFKLERFLCRPEGGGLASIAVVRNGLNWLQQRKLGVLMLGHRNVSALYFERGEMKTLDSPLIGFSEFLDSVVKMTSGLSRERVAQTIFRGLDTAGNSVFTREYNREYVARQSNYTEHPKWQELESIQRLATARDARLRSSEIEAIVVAINNATKLYRSKLYKWMSRIFSDNLDAAIISGGAARFLIPELEIYFNCEPIYNNVYSRGNSNECYVHTGEYQVRNSDYHFTPIIWGAGLQSKVATTFDLPDDDQSLSYRLVDAYGLFDQLLGKNSLSQKSAKSSSDSDNSSEEVS